jgi:opacity protein-like surface antigen
MKIKYVFLCLFVGFLSQAQSLKFGLKGGLNYSDPSIVNAKADSKIGYHLGGLVEFKFGKLGIQPELMYSTLGAHFNGNVVKSEADVGYLTLPVLVKVYFLKRFSIDAGPHASYAITKSTNSSISGLTMNEFLKVNDFDYGITAGVSADITNHFFAQIRGAYGFNEVTKDTGIAEVDTFEVKNRVIQLSIGYKF